MEKERLLAFTDGVIAVIITIMVLEMKVPQDASLGALGSVIPVFLSYVLSFVYVAIYWNNHHHFFHLVRHVNGGMLWLISTSCSGCRLYPSPPAGWGKITLLRSRPRSTASPC